MLELELDKVNVQSGVPGLNRNDAYRKTIAVPPLETQQAIGKKGRSNHRWRVGGKLCVIVNQWGRRVDWDWNTANVHDTVFHPLIRRFQQRIRLLSDHGVHAKPATRPT